MSTIPYHLGRRVCAFIAASATFVATQSLAVPNYDGLWSVSVVTEKGDCDRGYRYPIRISHGQLINAGDTMFTVTGKIAQTGAITVTVSAGGKSATGSGRLAGSMGGGSWSGGGLLWQLDRGAPRLLGRADLKTGRPCPFPLSGAKRTSRGRTWMSLIDPKPTSHSSAGIRFSSRHHKATQGGNLHNGGFCHILGATATLPVVCK